MTALKILSFLQMVLVVTQTVQAARYCAATLLNVFLSGGDVMAKMIVGMLRMNLTHVHHSIAPQVLDNIGNN